jgi:curli biogenesis system outer membrane secretion channel CsgG
MKINCLIISVLLMAILSSCTYRNKIVQVPQSTQPEISKTLTEPVKTLKRKVAIGRFSNETKAAKGFFATDYTDPHGKQAQDILSAKLTATEKFLLLERSDLDKINEELKIGKMPDSLKVNADYLIVGSVTAFGRKTDGDVGVFARSLKQTVNATVSIRLVDIYTSQVIYSEEASGEAYSEAKTVVGVGGEAGYDATLDDKAISVAISKLVNNIIQNLMDKPWRAYILDFQDNNFVLSGGKSQGIKEGDVFAVYKKGKKLKNPQTGIYIEMPGEKIGTIKVVSTISGNTVNDEISLCTAESGELPKSNFQDFYIQENK